MDDRELLEWAAKAYWNDTDVSFRYSAEDDAILFIDADNQDHNGQDVELVWSPLTDDGDALRLAVKFGIAIHFWFNHETKEIEQVSTSKRIGFVYADELTNTNSDKYSATRRAIVRAVAAIGQSQQGSKP